MTWATRPGIAAFFNELELQRIIKGLSPAMRKALAHFDQAGGVVHAYVGNVWNPPKRPTISALLARELVRAKPRFSVGAGRYFDYPLTDMGRAVAKRLTEMEQAND